MDTKLDLTLADIIKTDSKQKKDMQKSKKKTQQANAAKNQNKKKNAQNAGAKNNKISSVRSPVKTKSPGNAKDKSKALRQATQKLAAAKRQAKLSASRGTPDKANAAKNVRKAQRGVVTARVTPQKAKKNANRKQNNAKNNNNKNQNNNKGNNKNKNANNAQRTNKTMDLNKVPTLKVRVDTQQQKSSLPLLKGNTQVPMSTPGKSKQPSTAARVSRTARQGAKKRSQSQSSNNGPQRSTQKQQNRPRKVMSPPTKAGVKKNRTQKKVSNAAKATTLDERFSSATKRGRGRM